MKLEASLVVVVSAPVAALSVLDAPVSALADEEPAEEAPVADPAPSAPEDDPLDVSDDVPLDVADVPLSALAEDEEAIVDCLSCPEPPEAPPSAAAVSSDVPLLLFAPEPVLVVPEAVVEVCDPAGDAAVEVRAAGVVVVEVVVAAAGSPPVLATTEAAGVLLPQPAINMVEATAAAASRIRGARNG